MPSALFAQPTELSSISVHKFGSVLSFADSDGNCAYEKGSAVPLGRLRGFRSRNWRGPGAAEMRDGFEVGEEEIDVGEMTRRIAQGLTHDRNAVERLLMSPGRAATAEIFETTI
jgi:hypothetical protein